MRTVMRYISAASLLLMLAVTGIANPIIPASRQTAPILLKGGNVYTVSGDVQASTDILLDNGRITQIGQNLPIPAGAEVIDITGQNVYPGLIDAHTNLGLVEIGAVRATDDVGEVGQNNPDVQSQIAYNPDSEILPTVRSNGITTALVVPGGSLVQGRSTLMNLDGWTKEDAAEKFNVALHMNWPQAAVINAWWMEKTPEQQKKEMDENRSAIGRLFDDAHAYMLAKQADPTIKVDSRWEAMLPIFSGQLPVIIYADDYRQIEEAVDFSKKHGFRMILAGGKESWKLADLLKDNNIPVILSNTTSMPMRGDDGYDLAYTIPKLLQDAGLKYCIATFDASGARNLPFQAGLAAANGLTKEQALRAITLSPAEILGVEKDLGSLEVGKKATIVVSKGDILDPLTAGVKYVFIEGRKVDLDNRHKELYRKYEAKHTVPSSLHQ